MFCRGDDACCLISLLNASCRRRDYGTIVCSFNNCFWSSCSVWVAFFRTDFSLFSISSYLYLPDLFSFILHCQFYFMLQSFSMFVVLSEFLCPTRLACWSDRKGFFISSTQNLDEGDRAFCTSCIFCLYIGCWINALVESVAKSYIQLRRSLDMVSFKKDERWSFQMFFIDKNCWTCLHVFYITRALLVDLLDLPLERHVPCPPPSQTQ